MLPRRSDVSKRNWIVADGTERNRMRLKVDARLNYDFPAPADVLLALEIAQMPDQKLVEDKLIVASSMPLAPVEGHQGIGRRTWTRGEQGFAAHYHGIVDVDRQAPD